MYEDPKSKISQLEKVLDAREDRVTKKIKRHELHDQEIIVNEDWADNQFKVGGEVFSAPKEEVFSEPKPARVSSLSVKILIGSVIFFIVALGVVAFKFLGGGNMVSANNIEVLVKAPISISGGDVFPFEISIKNNNNVTLSGTDMGVTFPIGAKDVSDTSLPAKRVQAFIGDILPGQTIKKNLSVVLYGEENDKKDITINLEYKVAGSNSQFNKVKVLTVAINSSPVNIVVTGPAEVNTNQTVDFSVDVISNSPSIVKGLLLKAEYPFGFVFGRSDPKTFSKNNLWLIGDLEPGAKRTIKFSGVLSGQEGEARGFNFSIGSQSKADNLTIEVPFTKSFSSVTIRRPFVSADISLNGVNTAEYVAGAGEKIEVVIDWQNNLSYEVSDVSIVVKLSGNSLNKSTVEVEDGYYRSTDNTITFDKITNKPFASLQPGETGKNKFVFSSFGTGSVTGAGLSNPTISLSLSVRGKRVDYTGGQENVLFSDARKIKITTNPQLFAKALYYVGPFKNTGPIPPKAETETTYTITWTVTNPINNLSGTSVSASLPPYVKWLGKISPSGEKIDFDESTRLVTWNIGSISAGAGAVSPAKEVSYQISFLPSVDQISTLPKLIGAATLNAKDNFTLSAVTSSFSELNIGLSNDPYYKPNTETVTK